MTLRTLGSIVLPVDKIDPVTAGRTTISYIDIGSVESGKVTPLTPIAAAEAPGRARQVVRAGDTVFSTVRPYLRKIARVPIELENEFASTGFCVLRPGPEVDSRYLHYFVGSDAALEQVLPLQRGVSYPAVRDRDVLSTRIDLPSLAEQWRIVDILEDHLSRLDAGEQLAASAARRGDAMLRSFALQQLFGRGTQPLGSVLAAMIDDIELPSLSGRRWRRLGEVAEVVGGITKDSKRVDESMVEVPYLRVANVQRLALDLRDVRTIWVRAAKAAALRLRDGDVLMNEGGDRDKLARGWVWRGQIPDCIHQNHVYRARPNSELITSEWLAWSTNLLGGPWAERHGRQSVNLASISLSTIRKMPVPWTDLEEQRATAGALDELKRSSEKAQINVSALMTRSTSLRRALLSAAFSGRLTGRASDSDRIEELADAATHAR